MLFNATPLQDASLAILAILTVATLLQLVIAASYALRGRVPGIAAIIPFLLLSISYGLGVADFLTSSITDDFGVPYVPYRVIINIEIASKLCSGWANPALFLVVALVIRDRYLAYDGKGPNGVKAGLPLLLFMIMSYFLALIMVVLSSTSTGLYYAAILSDLSIDAVDAKIAVSDRVFYAYFAFYSLATIFLCPFAIVVKKIAKSDRVINTTLIGIIPLLCLRVVAQMILVIIRARNLTFGSINEDAFTIADITSNGVLYLLAISILCYLFLSIRVWIGPGDPAPQQYYGYPGYQQPLHAGMQPVAQFPGQWGFPEMQQQQGYIPSNMPYQTYPVPQGGGYYPNQLPERRYVQQYVQEPFQPNQPQPVVPALGETPGEEKRHVGSQPQTTTSANA